MIEIIKLYNRKYGDILTLDYPTTDEQIQKIYKYLSNINDEEIQEMLKDIKIPIIDTLKEYLILNDDKNKATIIKLEDIMDINVGKIENDMTNGNIFILIDSNNNECLINSISIDSYGCIHIHYKDTGITL